MHQLNTFSQRPKVWRSGWGLVMADTEDRPVVGLTPLSFEESADYCFHNAATCPECGGGMMRLGTCFVCGVCGSGGCEGN